MRKWNDTLYMTILKQAIKCAGLAITFGTIVYGAGQLLTSPSRSHKGTRGDHLVAVAGSKGLSKKHVNGVGKDAVATIAQLAAVATAAIELANHVTQNSAKDATVKAGLVKKSAPKVAAKTKSLIDTKEKLIVAHAVKTEKAAKKVIKASDKGVKVAKQRVAVLKKDADKATKVAIKRVKKNL